MMRPIFGFVLAVGFLAGNAVHGAILYRGTARIMNLIDGSQTTEQVLLKKVYDPQASSLTEISCHKDEVNAASISPVYMKIKGSSMQISNNSDFSIGYLSGTGELQGSAWNWKYLKRSMQLQTPHGVVSVDEAHFIVGKQIIGRKQMSFNGRRYQLREIEMVEMGQSDFAAQSKALGCPSF